MRHPTLLLAFTVALGTAAAAQEGAKKDPTAVPEKGDRVAVKGCLRGGALEAAELSAEDSETIVSSGLRFRLTGNKSLLKELKQKADGRLVGIRGVLKSQLLPADGYGAKLGRMRVTIGAPSSNPGSPAAEALRSVPVVEVTSFDATETGCTR